MLDRLSFLTYFTYVVVQAIGIGWRSGTSDRVTNLNSALFGITYGVTLPFILCWRPDEGIAHVLNTIIHAQAEKGET